MLKYTFHRLKADLCNFSIKPIGIENIEYYNKQTTESLCYWVE